MAALFKDPREGRTLVLCPTGIGAFIRATPALHALSRAVGPDRVSLCVSNVHTAALARAGGLFQRVHVWAPERDGWLKGAALLAEIRDDRYTHSLALFPASHWKDSLFQRAAGAMSRTGFRYPHERLPELVQHHSIPLAIVHDVSQNLRLVEAFLRDSLADPVAPYFPAPLKSPAGMPQGDFFACHPGSSADRGNIEKRLPPDAFAALIRRVHQETGWKCVLVGGPEEHALRAAVAMDCRECLVPVETRTLAETAGLLRAARFFLGNDSGPLHVAAAVGTRCAAYYGPTDEARTGPHGHEERLASPHGEGSAPRHLILRRADSKPLRTLDAIGLNAPLHRSEALARWNLDLPRTWPILRDWVASLSAS